MYTTCVTISTLRVGTETTTAGINIDRAAAYTTVRIGNDQLELCRTSTCGEGQGSRVATRDGVAGTADHTPSIGCAWLCVRNVGADVVAGSTACNSHRTADGAIWSNLINCSRAGTGSGTTVRLCNSYRINGTV